VADPGSAPPAPLRRPPPAPRPPLPRSAERTPPPPAPGLDSHWDRRFRAGAIEPDFTLDLHGHTLDQAHDRLDAGLAQAKTMGARVVLVIAGKPRPVDAADRGSKRGAIRAKLLDWLAAGPHGSSVAAVRAAHRKHGGEGALYLVLKRRG
jgi:DNA-nicking Smr family endonuclease